MLLILILQDMKNNIVVLTIVFLSNIGLIMSQDNRETVKLICIDTTNRTKVTFILDNILPTLNFIDSIKLRKEDIVKSRGIDENDKIHLKTRLNYILNDTVYGRQKDKITLARKVKSKEVRFIKKVPEAEARELYGTDITHDALVISTNNTVNFM